MKRSLPFMTHHCFTKRCIGIFNGTLMITSKSKFLLFHFSSIGLREKEMKILICLLYYYSHEKIVFYLTKYVCVVL